MIPYYCEQSINCEHNRGKEDYPIKTLPNYLIHLNHTVAKDPAEMPTMQHKVSTRVLKNNVFRFFETCRVRVKICSLPCSSIFLKKVIGLSVRRIKNATEKGNAKATSPWRETSSEGLTA